MSVLLRRGAREIELESEILRLTRSLTRARKNLARMSESLKITRRQLLQVSKLAADTPQFFNPLVVAEAKKTRDQVLKNQEDYV